MNLANLQRQLDEARLSAAPRIAILWGRECLLGTAVESILKSANNWQVARIMDDLDVNLLTREVEKLNPEILIILRGNCTDFLPPPLHLILKFPPMKIIAINSENNLIEIYTKQKVWVREASDLLTVIDHLDTQGLKEVNETDST